MMRWSYGEWHQGGWLAMGLVMLLFWGLVVAAVYLLIRSRRQRPHEARDESSTRHAEELLAERFARGEIDAAEFQGRRETLRTIGSS